MGLKTNEIFEFPPSPVASASAQSFGERVDALGFAIFDWERRRNEFRAPGGQKAPYYRNLSESVGIFRGAGGHQLKMQNVRFKMGTWKDWRSGDRPNLPTRMSALRVADPENVAGLGSSGTSLCRIVPLCTVWRGETIRLSVNVEQVEQSSRVSCMCTIMRVRSR